MNKLLKAPFAIIGIAIVAVGLSACSGTDQAAYSSGDSDLPSWVSSPPSNEAMLMGVGEGSSQQRRIALKQAKMRARNNIASQMSVQVDGYTQDFTESVSTDGREEITSFFVDVSEQVVSETLYGTSVEDQALIQDDGGYTAYVMMGMPTGKLAEVILNRIQSNQQAYARLRATEAFEDLEEEVEEYNEKRQSQADSGQ